MLLSDEHLRHPRHPSRVLIIEHHVHPYMTSHDHGNASEWSCTDPKRGILSRGVKWGWAAPT